MDLYCTRPSCQRPQNFFTDLDDEKVLKTVQQKFCITCGMPLILVGRYLPSKLLARGGFGAAFLARDRYTPGMRQCVVKQLQPSNLDPQQLEVVKDLFRREGEVLEDLGTHPQIPDLFAFFELPVAGRAPNQQEEYFYLVQEFIDGPTLEEELAERRKFSETQVLEVLQEMLQVLKFVHESGSIHRDIKLSNIMRQKPSTKTGKGRSRLYLLDFGAVKQVAKVAAGLPRQATGIYTPFFAPPEQIHGDQVFPSTDLYALAVTCISLLTGKEPAQLFDSYSNRWNWRSQAQVSDNLANILDRMLLTAPNQRFQSAAEVLTALNPFAQPTPSKTFKYHQPAWQAPPLNQPASPAAAKTPPLAPGNPPSSAPASPPVQVTAQPARPVSPPAKARFSLLELLGAAAFTGFEAGLLGIALISFFGTTFMSTGLWIVLLGALLFAQFRRLIERIDLVIVAAITLAIVLFVPGLQGGNPIQGIVVLAVLTGLSAVALTTLFRLIYSLLSRFL